LENSNALRWRFEMISVCAFAETMSRKIYDRPAPCGSAASVWPLGARAIILKTARALGLMISRDFLPIADDVIE